MTRPLPRVLSVLMLLAMLLTAFPSRAAALTDPTLQATAAYLLDPATGMVLYQKNADEKRYPASTTKIMTALVTLDKVKNLDEKVTVTQEDFTGVQSDSSKAGFVVGEEVPVIDLLYGLLLPSGNEAANTLARHVGGSIEGFVKLMNERAQQLGCTNTHFVNPNGLHNPDHYTTAHDLALIASEAMKNETFALIANTAQKTLSPTNKLAEHGGKPLKVFTTNMLIFSRNDPNYYSYAKGIKTGHTSEAGYCLVSTAERRGSSLIAVVLGTPKPAGASQPLSFAESKTLYEWGFSNFDTRTLIEKGTTTEEIPIRLSTDADHIVPQVGQTLQAIVPKDIDLDKLVMTKHLPKDLCAPIKAGEVIGTMDVSYNGIKYGTVDLVAMQNVSLSKVLYYADKLNNFFRSTLFKLIVAVLALLLIVYILYIVILGRRRRKRRDRMMRSKQTRYRRYK